MKSKLRIAFYFLFLSLFIIPFISFIITHVSFNMIKPNMEKIELFPKRKDDCLFFEHPLKISQKSSVYLTIKLPESKINLENHSFFANINGEDVFFTMKYKSYFYTIIDTLLFFPLIKLNFYTQEQVLKRKLDIDTNFNMKIKSSMQFNEFYIDIVEDCHWLKMFIYKHEVVSKCLSYFLIFGLFFYMVLFGTILIYKNIEQIPIEDIIELTEE